MKKSRQKSQEYDYARKRCHAALDGLFREMLAYVIIELSSNTKGTICDPAHEILPYRGQDGQRQAVLMVRIEGDTAAESQLLSQVFLAQNPKMMCAVVHSLKKH